MEYTQQYSILITQEITTNTLDMIYYSYIADLIQNGADLEYK
jgi:hypothetical protein